MESEVEKQLAREEKRGAGRNVRHAIKKPAKNGKSQRQRGDRFEREVVVDLFNMGVPAKRVPLSGSAGGEFGGDVRADVCGERSIIECKMRKDGFTPLYNWLAGSEGVVPDYLAIRQDNHKTLVVMPLETFAKLAKGIL